VRLQALTAYDPIGADGEHGEKANLATDRDPETGWDTEQYNDFTKDGVGLVVQAPRAVALSRLTVASPGGYEALIRASNSSTGDFVDVSGDWQAVASPRTGFKIDTKGKDYRFYLIWLRLPRSGGQAEINEVTART
jgi:hypothetical protein